MKKAGHEQNSDENSQPELALYVLNQQARTNGTDISNVLRKNS